uniref:Uncharacterized protein n=1 Tax=Natrinema zhouii TaxID=1710539 RepID=A0A7D6CQV2_9EURY
MEGQDWLRVLRRRHLLAGLGTLAKHVSTDLAVFFIVLFALVCTLFACISTGFCKLRTVVRVPRHEPCVHRREIGDIPTETKTLGHPFAFTSAFISAPFTRLSGFETIVDALCHLVILAYVFDLS